MNELQNFYRLKEEVLLKYKEHYPYFNGNWQRFGTQEIQNLITLIEENCKQTISEKWIYTHLKPEQNEKIPRKDMLNILSVFTGYSGWDEFVFEEDEVSKISKESKEFIKSIESKEIIKSIESKESEKNKESKKNNYWLWLLLFLLVIAFGIWFFTNKASSNKTVEIKNEFTNDFVKSDELKVYNLSDSTKKSIDIIDGKINLTESDSLVKLVVVSPFYGNDTIVVGPNTTDDPITAIQLKPDDYALMLKAFLISDIKDWKTRKEQLNKILSDDVEVLMMLKDNLGAEYFNKNEFLQKVTIPSPSLKKMKIIEINKDNQQKINFIRLIQE